jgi:hypothetical protein
VGRGAAFDQYRIPTSHIRSAGQIEIIVVSFTPKDVRLLPISRRLLKSVKERNGISESEQIRPATRGWLENKDVLKRAAPRRAGTRQRA